LKVRTMRFPSTDLFRMLVLACCVLLLALGGVKLADLVAGRTLRTEAEASAKSWVATLVDHADDIPAMVTGQPPSAKTQYLLKLASQAGKVYRYKVWNSHGELVFISDSMGSPRVPSTLAQHHGKSAADSILSGSVLTEAAKGKTPGAPSYFAESYVPIYQHGVVVGVFEAYLDQTERQELFMRSFLLVECIIALGFLLAAGVPGWMAYRKMRDYRKVQAEVLFLAEHDSLTGVANRAYLEEAAKSALAWSRRMKSFVAVILIDVDRLKNVNDSFGHEAGDQVLREIARRLKSTVRAEDTAGRFGGDEFIVLQVGIAQPSGAISIADRFMEVLCQPYDLAGAKVNCSVSIGIAIAPTDADDWDQLLSCADAALSKAKSSGRNTVCFFEAGMDARLRQRRQLEVQLRHALEVNLFQLAYQPLFSFHDHSLIGFETLLRWPDGWSPESPAAFIPIAEESRIIVPIGAWVLETACKTAAAWSKPLKVAVNLSPVQFYHGDIVALVEESLRISGLDPARLELEVTEGLWLKDTDTVLDQLVRLRALGVSIALDDFGTGYSSLTYLLKFPFDAIKIDRSFVIEMQRDPKAGAIVKTIVAMGKALGLAITAEGVETAAQARAVREAGCDQGQGYWFGHPLSLNAANTLVQASPMTFDAVSVIERE
jgi:diguanylate cyclase (GGDEF)-like protein